MWPKNILFYRVNHEDFTIDKNTIEQQVSEFSYKPCGPTDKQRFGWTSVFPGVKEQVFIDNNLLVLRAKKEEKILPASVINDEVKEKVSEIEIKEDRRLKKVERDRIKEDVLLDLLPRAFSRKSYTTIIADLESGLFMVDCGSFKKAEDVLSLLRKTIGSLPVVPAIPEKAIESTLTEWVKSEYEPSGITILAEAELKSVVEAGGIIRCKDQDLKTDEVINHIDANKFVTKLALCWQDRITFVLSEDGSYKRIKFSEELSEQNMDIPKDDVWGLCSANYQLIASELVAMFKDMTKQLESD
ncbi:recombination-associated protein RdgC (plasmid) [Vibrio breoganii]|uniref:Recombination-associated protein RdgC n=1 Tax=Vibrio breoganii TaxID=553239 RepID=A0AAN0XZE4_9VIBR|nr:recombination-associated protein RdgC [Vibrio breoganii]ANO35444.1 recombination-associated protein RdgC [Vibrio breoganii]PML13953.1 recombination-associated protein RdgC [Vibrio breoganii]